MIKIRDNGRSFNIRNIAKLLRDNDKIIIENFGVFTLKPARRGKINGIGLGQKPKYTKRISFKPSEKLKNKVCK